MKTWAFFLLASALVGQFAGAEDSLLDHLRDNQREHYEAELNFASQTNVDPAGDLVEDALLLFCETGQILHDKEPGDRFYDVFRHTSLPIYFYKFASKKYQDLTFDRISDFVEQDAKSLVSPERHQYPEDDGNDVRGQDVADFFNAMDSRGSHLTSFEERLKSSLLKSGNFARAPDGRLVAPRNFAVVSAAADSSEGTVEHEISHAVYFTDPAYRQKVIDLFESLSTAEKQLVSRILDDIGGHKFEASKETFYTEFGAYFRDPAVLYRDSSEDHEFTDGDRRLVTKVAQRMSEIEAATPYFAGCGSTALPLRSLSLLNPAARAGGHRPVCISPPIDRP